MNAGKHAKGFAPHLRRLAKDVAYTKGHAEVMLAAADELERLERDNGIMLDAEYRSSDFQRARAEKAEALVKRVREWLISSIRPMHASFHEGYYAAMRDVQRILD